MSLRHPKFAFEKGLHDIGDGIYAWLQPDGGWGWSNAGLICDSGESLVVDTLMDAPLTQTMLDRFLDAERECMTEIDAVVNTHHNGDHCNGNSCCGNAQIISHVSTKQEMAKEDPASMVAMIDAADDFGDLGIFIKENFGCFDLKSVKQRLPDRTFENALTLNVGDKEVLLKHVGPAHSAGDTLVYVPEDKVLYTGDILFIEGHPITWGGPVANWIDACDYMLGLDLEVIVPGHGPITTKVGVQAIRDYFVYISAEARRRFDAGMAYEEAAREIAAHDYQSWGDAERIALNCAALYKEFGSDEVPGPGAAAALMARLFVERRGR